MDNTIKIFNANINVNPDLSRSFTHTSSELAKDAFFYVQSAGHFLCEKDYLTEREGYESYLALYTIGGKGHLDYRGRHYELNPGQAFIIYCHEYQKYFTDKNSFWEIKWVHFNGCSSSRYFEMIYAGNGLIADTGHSGVSECIDEITGLMENRDMLFDIKASPILLKMLTEFALPSKGREGINTQHNSAVEAAVKFIEAHYRDDISLDDISRSACLSKFNFSRLFHRITGYSPYEYLIKYRINKAKQLLSRTDIPIGDITASVGFNSASSFIKTFRDLENTTPHKFRKLRAGG